MNHTQCPMNKNSSAFGNPQSGFTFVELIVAMIMIGVLAAVAFPRIGFDPSPMASVEGAAHMIASDLRYAQEFSMAKSVSKTVAFSSGSTVYHFTPSYSLDPSGRLPSGVMITKDLRVKFNSLGEPTFEVGDGTVTISGGGLTKTIHVENYTGKVTIP